MGTSGNSGRADGGIQSVARALAILELFDSNRAELTTSEIAQLSKLNRGTAYRFCQTLKRLGYLDEVNQGAYRPGLKVLSLAQGALSTIELVDIAMPRLQALRESTGETVNLAMPNWTDVVYVARLLNDDILALRLTVGSRLPMVSSSLGRAMLAFMDHADVEAIVAASRFERFTTHTLTSAEKLRSELEKIRTNGYAFNDQELALGVRGIAAPVLDGNHRPIAAINLSIARPVDDGDLRARLVPELLSAAADVAERVRRIGQLHLQSPPEISNSLSG